ncbi:MAG: hypothetical protein ABW321_27125 [Polyangiales bacterium]
MNPLVARVRRLAPHGDLATTNDTRPDACSTGGTSRAPPSCARGAMLCHLEPAMHASSSVTGHRSQPPHHRSAPTKGARFARLLQLTRRAQLVQTENPTRRAHTQLAQLARLVELARDERGASMVEVLVVIAIFVLGSIVAVRALQGSADTAAQTAGDRVIQMLGTEDFTPDRGVALLGSEARSDAPPVVQASEVAFATVAFEQGGPVQTTLQLAGPDGPGSGRLEPNLAEIRAIIGAGASEQRDRYGIPRVDPRRDDLGYLFTSDLERVNQLLAELTPRERNYAISQLSDAALASFIDNMDNLFFGLGADQQRALFDSLAEGLDGPQALRFYDALETDEQRRAFIDALRQHASPAQQADFVAAAAAGGRLQNDPALARQVGQLLAAPDPLLDRTPDGVPIIDQRDNAFFDRAFGALSPADVAAILRATNTDELRGGQHGDSFGYDLAGVGARILESADNVEDYETRQRVFEGAASELQRVALETDGLADASGASGGVGPVITEAARLILPYDVAHSSAPPAERGAALTEQLNPQLHGDRAFSDAYNMFAQATVLTDHQAALNEVLVPIESAALPVDGQGGSEDASHLLGEIIGRQVYAVNQLNSQNRNRSGNAERLGVQAAAGVGKEVVPLLFGTVTSRLVAGGAVQLTPLLFPEREPYIRPGEVAPRGESEHVEDLRDAFALGYVQGSNAF